MDFRPMPLTNHRIPWELRYFDGTFTNQRGQNLSYCVVFPPTESLTLRGIYLFLHDLTDHCRRLLHVYKQLCFHGYGVLAYDMISHGHSDNCPHNIRAHARKFKYFVDDTNEFITLAHTTIYPRLGIQPNAVASLPLIISGQSFGALVAIHTVLSNQHPISAMVFVSPAIAPTWTPLKRVQAVFRKPLSKLFPKAHIVPLATEEHINRDPAFIDDYANDPLTTHTSIKMISVRMATECFEAMLVLKNDKQVEDSQSTFCSLPLLCMVGSAGRVTDIASAKIFYDRLASTDKEWKVFDGAFHALFDDPEQEDIVNYLINWLKARFG